MGEGQGGGDKIDVDLVSYLFTLPLIPSHPRQRRIFDNGGETGCAGNSGDTILILGLGPGLPGFKRPPVAFSIFSMKPLSPTGLPVLSCLRKASIVSVLKKACCRRLPRCVMWCTKPGTTILAILGTTFLRYQHRSLSVNN